MNITASTVREKYQEPRVATQVPHFRRKAVDPDTALVEGLRREDPEAVEALVNTYGDRVYRLAIGITGNAADAEEVVQDALWTASRKIGTFRGEAAFGSWLYRITANAAYQKRRGSHGRQSEIPWDDVAPSLDDRGQQIGEAIVWSGRLTDPAIEWELKSVIGSAIDELPQGYRAPFLLRDVEGLSNVEVAEALQVTVSTVKSRVHRARLFLRRRLAHYMSATVRKDTAVERLHPGIFGSGLTLHH